MRRSRYTELCLEYYEYRMVLELTPEIENLVVSLYKNSDSYNPSNLLIALAILKDESEKSGKGS